MRDLINNFLNRIEFKTPGNYELMEEIFIVRMDKILNSYGFGYHKDHFNPLVKLINHYSMGSEMAYETSILKKFNQKFSPKNLQEAITGIISYPEGNTAKIAYPIGYSIFRVSCMPMPWTRCKFDLYKGNWDPEANSPVKLRDCIGGENSKVEELLDKEAMWHYQRTIKTYESIKNNGYKPELFSDMSRKNGYIRGVILKKEDEYRFIVLGGQHRVAALSCLDYEEVPVIFDTNMAIVDYKNINNWPVIRKGIYDLKDAQIIFNGFFEDDGIKKAKIFGVI